MKLYGVHIDLERPTPADLEIDDTCRRAREALAAMDPSLELALVRLWETSGSRCEWVR